MENMPPLLSGSSLSFTTIVPVLFNSDSTPSSFSSVWGSQCGGQLWLGHIQKLPGARLLQTFRPCRGTLPLTGFWVGQFHPLPSESGHLGVLLFSDLSDTSLLHSAFSCTDIVLLGGLSSPA